MKNLRLFFVFFLIATVACNKDKPIEDLEPGLIENQTFTSTVFLDGSKYDRTIIRNCVFENMEDDGLQLRDVKNVKIENCSFRNIKGNAIRFRNSGTSEGVQLLNNTICNIEKNGILAPENHINCLIKGNTIRNVATDNTSSRFGAPHHGIYFQGFNVTITENKIYDVINNEGNAVSIRTYGTISKNILYNAKDHGISYFSDHPANSGALLIENNIIYNNGKRAINLASNGNSSNHIGSALVRFNTLLSNNQSVIGTNDDLTGVGFEYIGNILIRTDGGSNYIFSNLTYTVRNNLKASGDIGFSNFNQRNLKITSSSSANGFASGETNFPTEDIDGDTRSSLSLDAGADEI